MHEFFEQSVFFGVFITLAAYFIGVRIRRKTNLTIMNPLLISFSMLIALLLFLDIPYDIYNQGAKLISSLLTPATICLAVPLYEQFELLKKHKYAILSGIVSGVITSLVCVLALCVLLRMDHQAYVTLLPKSVTSAFGMGISQELGGHVSITVSVIIITGVIGSIISETVFKIFRINNPVARGIAIGTSSHAIGTAKAMQLGRIEGAMSSLSLVISGVLTVFGASVFAAFY